MEPRYVSPADTALSLLIILVSLALVPASLTWWLIAQHVNSRMMRAGRQLHGGRWHFLRFGPTAPLLSAAAFLCGTLAYSVPQIHDALDPEVSFAALILAACSLFSFMMSMVLWSYSNAPPRQTTN